MLTVVTAVLDLRAPRRTPSRWRSGRPDSAGTEMRRRHHHVEAGATRGRGERPQPGRVDAVVVRDRTFKSGVDRTSRIGIPAAENAERVLVAKSGGNGKATRPSSDHEFRPRLPATDRQSARRRRTTPDRPGPSQVNHSIRPPHEGLQGTSASLKVLPGWKPLIELVSVLGGKWLQITISPFRSGRAAMEQPR